MSKSLKGGGGGGCCKSKSLHNLSAVDVDTSQFRNLSQFIIDLNNNTDVTTGLGGDGLSTICPIRCDFVRADELIEAKNANIGIELNIGTGDLILSENRILSNNDDIILEPVTNGKIQIESNLEVNGSLTKICTENLEICDPVPIIGLKEELLGGGTIDDLDDRGFQFDWPEPLTGGVFKRMGFFGWDRSKDRFVFWKRTAINTGTSGFDQNYQRASSELNAAEFDVIYTTEIKGGDDPLLPNSNLNINTPTALSIVSLLENHTTENLNYNVKFDEEHIIGIQPASLKNGSFVVRSFVNPTQNRIELDLDSETLNLYQEDDIEIKTFTNNGNTSGILIDSGDQINMNAFNSLNIDSTAGAITITADESVLVQSETSSTTIQAGTSILPTLVTTVDDVAILADDQINFEAVNVITLKSQTDYVKIDDTLRVDKITSCNATDPIEVQIDLCITTGNRLLTNTINEKDTNITIESLTGDVAVISDAIYTVVAGTTLTQTSATTSSYLTTNGDLTITAGGAGKDVIVNAASDSINMNADRTLFEYFLEFQPRNNTSIATPSTEASNDNASIWFDTTGTTDRVVTNFSTSKRPLILGPSADATVSEVGAIAVYTTNRGHVIGDSNIRIIDNDMTIRHDGTSGTIIFEDSNDNYTYTITALDLTANRTLQLPPFGELTSTIDTFVMKAATQTLTNKTLCSSTNDIVANKVWLNGGEKVEIVANPTGAEQVLAITTYAAGGPHSASWATLDGNSLNGAYLAGLSTDKPPAGVDLGSIYLTTAIGLIRILNSTGPQILTNVFEVADNGATDKYFTVAPNASQFGTIGALGGNNLTIVGTGGTTDNVLNVQKNSGSSILRVRPDASLTAKQMILTGNLSVTGNICDFDGLEFDPIAAVPTGVISSDTVWMDVSKRLRRSTNHIVEITEANRTLVTTNRIAVFDLATNRLIEPACGSTGIASITVSGSNCVLNIDEIDADDLDINNLTVNTTATFNGISTFNALADFNSTVTLDGPTTLSNGNEMIIIGDLCIDILGILKFKDSGGANDYIFTPSIIGANRNMILPPLTGNDTFVFEAQIQTLTNKTLLDTTTVIANAADTTKTLAFDLSNSSAGVDISISNDAVAVDVDLTLPVPFLSDGTTKTGTGGIMSQNSIDTQINKTICDVSNDVAANKFITISGVLGGYTVTINDLSSPPAVGDVLAVDSLGVGTAVASWQGQTGGGGGGSGAGSLQTAYDFGAGDGDIDLDGGGPLHLFDDAVPIGDLFKVTNSADSVDYLVVSPTTVQIGQDPGITTDLTLFGDGTVSGDFTISGKLTVVGLIDPTGLEITPVATNPGGITANTLWLDSTNVSNPNRLTHGTRPVILGTAGTSTTNGLVTFATTNGDRTTSGSSITAIGNIMTVPTTGHIKVDRIEDNVSGGVLLVTPRVSNVAGTFYAELVAGFSVNRTLTIPQPATAATESLTITNPLTQQTIRNTAYIDPILRDSGTSNNAIINLSGLTASRTLSVPNATTTIVGTDATQTLSNKKFSDNLDMCSNRVINLANPVDSGDAVNLAWASAFVSGLTLIGAVDVATTVSLTSEGVGFLYNMITDLITFSTYPTSLDSFVLTNGDRVLVKDNCEQEVTSITVVDKSLYQDNSTAYFDIQVIDGALATTADYDNYRLWFKTNALTTAPPLPSTLPPVITSGTVTNSLVEVDLTGITTTGGTPETSNIGAEIASAVNALTDVSTTGTTSVTILNDNNGDVIDISGGNLPAGVTLAVVVQGNFSFGGGDKERSTFTLDTVGINGPVLVSDFPSGVADYFDIYSAENETKYRCYFDIVGTGVGVPPITTETLVQIDISGDTLASAVASTVASTLTAVNGGVDFSAGSAGAIVTVTNVNDGVATNATETVTYVGFLISTTTPGEGAENGIWTYSSASAWIRETDFDIVSATEITLGAHIPVLNGTTNAQTSWVVGEVPATTADIGEQNIKFGKFLDDVKNIIAGDGLIFNAITTNQLDVVGSTLIRANADNIQIDSSATANQVLLSSGTLTTEPTYGALPLTDPVSVTGTLTVPNGGTGAATLPTGFFLEGNGTGTIITTKVIPTGVVVGTTDTQILTNKTFVSPIMTTPEINDSSADHQYVFAVNELVADRTVTLPLLISDDEFVFGAHIQTLTNKTITGATLTGSTTQTSGIFTVSAAASFVSANNEIEFVAGTNTINLVGDSVAAAGGPFNVTLPAATGELITENSVNVLTNKTITNTGTNIVHATHLGTTGTSVTVATGPQPVIYTTTTASRLVGELLEASTTIDSSWNSFTFQKAYDSQGIAGGSVDITLDEVLGGLTILDNGAISGNIFRVTDFTSTLNYIKIDSSAAIPVVFSEPSTFTGTTSFTSTVTFADIDTDLIKNDTAAGIIIQGDTTGTANGFVMLRSQSSINAAPTDTPGVADLYLLASNDILIKNNSDSALITIDGDHIETNSIGVDSSILTVVGDGTINGGYMGIRVMSDGNSAPSLPVIPINGTMYLNGEFISSKSLSSTIIQTGSSSNAFMRIMADIAGGGIPTAASSGTNNGSIYIGTAATFETYSNSGTIIKTVDSTGAVTVGTTISSGEDTVGNGYINIIVETSTTTAAGTNTTAGNLNLAAALDINATAQDCINLSGIGHVTIQAGNMTTVSGGYASIRASTATATGPIINVLDGNTNLLAANDIHEYASRNINIKAGFDNVPTGTDGYVHLGASTIGFLPITPTSLDPGNVYISGADNGTSIVELIADNKVLVTGDFHVTGAIEINGVITDTLGIAFAERLTRPINPVVGEGLLWVNINDNLVLTKDGPIDTVIISGVESDLTRVYKSNPNGQMLLNKIQGSAQFVDAQNSIGDMFEIINNPNIVVPINYLKVNSGAGIVIGDEATEDPFNINPFLTNGVEITTLTTDTSSTVANLTRDKIGEFLIIQNASLGAVTLVVDGAVTTGFTFVQLTIGSAAEAELTNITVVDGPTLATSITSPFFTLEAPGPTSYYVWFSNVGLGFVDPTPGGTGIEVPFTVIDSKNNIANQTRSAINAVIDFESENFITDRIDFVQFETTVIGVVTITTDGGTASGFDFTQEQIGSGTATEITRIRFNGGPSLVNTALAAKHFEIYTTTIAYYVWYDTGNAEVDPGLGGFTGIPVIISATATSNEVATSTMAAITAIAPVDFTSIIIESPNIIATTRITNNIIGLVTPPSLATASLIGFSVEETQSGVAYATLITDLSVTNKQFIELKAVAGVAAPYILLYTTTGSFYVWWNTGNGELDPAIVGFTGIMVDISAATIVTAIDVADETRDIINTDITASANFSAETAFAEIEVMNSGFGSATDLTITTNMPVESELLIFQQGFPTFQEISTIKIPLANKFKNSTTGAYFFNLTSATSVGYYFWYNLTDLIANDVNLKVNGETFIAGETRIEATVRKPIGLEFRPTASKATANPNGLITEQDKTLWVEDGTNSLKFGDSSLLTVTSGLTTLNAITKFANTSGTALSNSGILISTADIISGATQIGSERFAMGTFVVTIPKSVLIVDGLGARNEGIYVLNTNVGSSPSDFTLPSASSVGRIFIFRNNSVTDNMELKKPDTSIVDTLGSNEVLVVQEMDLGGGDDWEILFKISVPNETVNVSTITGTVDVATTTQKTFVLNTTSGTDSTYKLPTINTPNTGRKFTFRNNGTDNLIIKDAGAATTYTTLGPDGFAIIQEMDLGGGDDWGVLFKGSSSI
jgi:hypothetical protein